ncbi:uncharacterized protein LOC120116977 [Hibiscus syriacus]|uniref:uncharacterized protein LOC120116977 n=1 Tax=Hibiscus syriacus TaxID=106335 RepID=UPI001923C717|nr:uncharacterized protein LOC120116977 [Hibiscus syriacus]
MSGGRFTWCNNREVPTFERLDRFLVDQRLVILFPRISQSLQPRSVSDHNIILLENKECNWGLKSFRLFNYVMEEDGFTEMMEKELDKFCREEKGKPMSRVLKRVKDVVKRWSGRGYLELPGKIKLLEKGIHDMELDMQQGLPSVTMKSIIEAKKELWELHKKEESIWLQKSRLKWRINSLEAEELNLDFLKLSEGQSLALEKPFLEEEGNEWDLEVNHSFISLIPKKDNTEGMGDFRPISLVGGLYKILSKVLARRFSLCINEIEESVEGVVFKVDFKRAYDSVDWSVLLKIMGKMGFGEKWHSWMYHCIPTASISVLVNGTPTEIIHMERVDMGLFSGFELGVQDRSFKPSHLQFADDLIIVSKASIRDLKNVTRVLLIYELLVGLKINLVKSRIFGINVEEDVLADWSKEIGYGVVEIKLDHGCFFIGGSTDKRNIYWVNWELVSKPRRLEGLGILNLAILNRALLGKWVWKFASVKDSWWKRVVCCVNNLDPSCKMLENTWTARASWIWRGVINNFFSNDVFGDCIRNNLRLKAGNGHSVAFWNDVWLGEVPLKDLFPRLYALSINKMGKVVEFRANNVTGWVWDIQMRRNLVDCEIEQWLHLISMLNNISLSHEEEDCWIWFGNREGCFSTNYCIKSFLDSVNIEGNQDFWDRNIWVGIAPPRIETFLWQVVHQRVAVKEELLKRGVVGIEDPLYGFLKINVDGAMVKGWTKGGIGGLIRDISGVLIHWFSENVRGGPLILAELLAIKRGLSLLNDSSLVLNQRIILESDSSVAMKWINNLELSNPIFQSLVKEIVSLKEGKDILLRLILRAANWEADRLAKDGIG